MNGVMTKPEMVVEMVGDEPYEYYPLGEYVVWAVGVCGGRPTFKYTRIEVSVIMAFLRMGETIAEIADDYHSPHITKEAIQEAIALASEAFETTAMSMQPAMV